MPQHPTEESINITRKFLGGDRSPSTQDVRPSGSDVGTIDSTQSTRIGTGVSPSRLPSQAAPIAGRRAFGAQGARRRKGADLIEPMIVPPYVPPGNIDPNQQPPESSLGEQFFNLPGPVGFARTPQGQAMLQRILGSVGRRR